MPLATARCRGCSQPLGAPPYIIVPCPCIACGEVNQVQLAADGQPPDFDAQFSVQKLLKWFAGARASMSRGMLGISIGCCTKCEAPLAIDPERPISLPCPHCQLAVEGPARELLIDLWPEPYTHVTGSAETDMEFRLAIVTAESGQMAGCAHCAAPSPARDSSNACRRCRSIVWIDRIDSRSVPPKHERMQLGVRADGTNTGRPYNALLPISQGEMLLRNASRNAATAKSGSMALGYTGIGCAAITALFVVVGLLIAMLARYLK